MARTRSEAFRVRACAERPLSRVRRRVDRGVVLAAALLAAAIAVAAAPSSPNVRPTDRSPDVTAANHRAWGSVSLVDGLPSDAVNAICQGTDGAIWFATDRGLAVQDGRGTRLVGLGSAEPRRVSALAPLADGRILVATDAGLMIVDGESAAPYAEGSTTPVCAVATDASGSGAVVVASEDGRLLVDAASGGTFSVVDLAWQATPASARAGETAPDLAAIALRGGEIFVASRRSGLLRLAGGNVVQGVRGLPTSVSALAVDPSDGSLWIGVAYGLRQGGVYRLDSSERLATISTDVGAVTGLTAGGAGTCWVATAASGAYLVSANGIERHETFASTIGGLRSDTLSCAFMDREGVVWLGGDRGASRFDTRGSESRLVGPDANGDVVRSISRIAGRLWVGTNRGLVEGASATALAPVAGLDGRTVFDVESAHDGRLLAATQQGVFAAVASRGSPVFAPLDAAEGSVEVRARSIAVLGSTTYVGTFGAGLLLLDGDALRSVDFVGAGDSLRDIVCLHVDNAEAMWIGTAGRGAYRCDSAGLTPLDSETLAGRTIYAIAGSESATLWFATNSGLVVRDGSVEGRILTDCDVRSVVPMGERAALCATANRGAVLVAWDERFGWLESRIDEERGLPSDITFAVDVVPGVDGQSFDALIGTSRGLTAYRTSAAAPVVGVAGALANRLITPAEIESGIVLAYPQRSVVLELFATSTRTFRGQFQYGYTVATAGGTPVTHGLIRDGKVSLDRLAPGEYRIDAVAFDNDLVASKVRSVRVTVERAPFPWTTAGLAALLLIAVLVLVWGARQNRTIARTNDALRTANTDLADARAQVASETERERSRIARDLHDQTLADLRRLMLLADKLPAPISDVSPRPGELRQRIEEVSGEIRRICEDLSPSALSNLGLGPALEWLVIQAQSEMPTEQRFTASVSFSDRLDERIDPGSDLPIQIYRIVQEAISNVCRHAKATHVEVDARVDEAGDLTIRIRDDGVGFDDSAEPSGSGRGLGNMRWRADMIHASIGWSRLPGGGTEVTLRRPDENRSADTTEREP